jgi:hypothetical protein
MTNINFNDAFRKVNDTHSTIAVGPRQLSKMEHPIRGEPRLVINSYWELYNWARIESGLLWADC